MRMAERVHGDAGGEIEIALAVGRDEPGAFAPLEGEVDACECRQQMRRHDAACFRCFAHALGESVAPGIRSGRGRLAGRSMRQFQPGGEMKCAAFRGGTLAYSIAVRRGVNTTILIAIMS